VTISEIIATSISVVALLVSAFTLYFSSLRRVNLSIILGDQASFTYGHNGTLKFETDLTFINAGARTGFVTKIVGDFTNETGVVASFDWKCFVRSLNASKPNEPPKPFSTFEKWIHTIVVPPIDAKVCNIGFVSRSQFALQEGQYDLTLTAYGGAAGKCVAQVSHSYSFSRDEIDFLFNKCTEDEHGLTIDSLALRNDIVLLAK
jgi:hypothetical protein